MLGGSRDLPQSNVQFERGVSCTKTNVVNKDG